MRFKRTFRKKTKLFPLVATNALHETSKDPEEENIYDVLGQ